VGQEGKVCLFTNAIESIYQVGPMVYPVGAFSYEVDGGFRAA
jgi:hypothetical protein